MLRLPAPVGPLALLLAVLILAVAAPQAVAAPPERHLVFLEGHEELLAALAAEGLPRMELLARLKAENGKALRGLDAVRGLRVVRRYPSIRAALVSGDPEEIRRRGLRVRRVVPDRMERPERPVSEDGADPGPENAYAYGLPLIGADRVQREFGITGRGVTVGIIDSGLDGTHPEFKDISRIAAYRDFVGGPSDVARMTDSSGHGTHVAGTIAGGALSGRRIGVAPGARLVIAKALGRSGARISTLLAAMEWMMDPDGNPATDDAPRAVNCSWHSGYGDQEPYYAMIDTWLTLGIVPCFSAGNSGPNAGTITRPKEHPGTFATAAVDAQSAIARFSSRGPGRFRGVATPRPDWAAPGVDVYSARAGGGYITKSGTSMASPHVCGVVALIAEVRPELPPAAIRELFRHTAVDLGDPGYDYAYGHGLLDAYRAVRLARGSGDGAAGPAEAADLDLPRPPRD